MNLAMQHQEGVAVYSARVFAGPLARVGVPLPSRQLMCSACKTSGDGVARTGGGAVWGRCSAPQQDFHGLFSSRGNDRGNIWCARRVRRAHRLPVNWPRVPTRTRGSFFEEISMTVFSILFSLHGVGHDIGCCSSRGALRDRD
jgi:hypothetical protein